MSHATQAPGEVRSGEDEDLTFLIRHLAERGDQPALVAFGQEGAREWSCRQLADDAKRLARGLVAAGVRKGDRVVVLAASRPEPVIACLGTIAAGAVAVPVDVQFPAETLAHIFNDGEPRIVFADSDQAERIASLAEEAGCELVLLDERDDRRNWKGLASGEGDLPEVDADDAVVLFYTSGTTGPPKGVPLTHRNLLVQIRAIDEAAFLQKDDRALLPLPLHHVYPFVIGLLAPLSLDVPVVLPRALTGPEIRRALNEGDASIIIGVPRLYSAVYQGIEAKVGSSGRIARGLFYGIRGVSSFSRRFLKLNVGSVLFRPLHKKVAPRLRVLASGGSPLDPDLAKNLEGLGWNIAIGYGLTETSPLLTLTRPGAGHLETVGRPISEVELRIDPSPLAEEESEDRSDDAPESGEILARGPGVFKGYWNLPEKTEEVLTDDGWFRTGDLGFLDDEGYLHVLGRVSTMIVTEGGENVQPDDVEEAYEKSPLIREVGVLSREKRLVAVLVPDVREAKHGSDGDGDMKEAVRGAVSERSRQLPSYQRISDFVLTRQPLPRTRLGKIRRHQLEKRFEEARKGDGKPAEAGPMPIEEMPEEERALLENKAAREVWDWLAERFPDEPLRPESDPELELGIDSMEWLNLTLEISQRTGVELDDEAISRVQTVHDLLEEVRQASEGAGAGAHLLEHPEEAISDEQRHLLKPPGVVGRSAAQAGYWLNRLLIRFPFRLEVRGSEHLPERGPYLITPNHVSYLDPFVIAASLDSARLKEAYWAGWAAYAFKNRSTRFVSRLAKTIPIDPRSGIISSIALGAAVLKRGNILVWFPEGERSPKGDLLEFKPGLGLVLEHHPVPVVPAFIRGTCEALPIGRFLPRLKKITVTYGPPVDTDELKQQVEGEDSHQRLAEALREKVRELGRQ